MSEVMEAPAVEAPAAAAPVAAPAAPESLVHDAAAAPAPAADPAAPPEFTFAEKVVVKAADGATDWEATARNAEKARQHLEKRLGAGDTPPASPAEYTYTVPEELGEFTLQPERLDAFKAEALANGVTGKQFEWMMSSYLKAVPDLMEGAATLSANEARAELAKVWTAPDAMSQGLDSATRAIRALPPELQAATREYGTNPVFLRAMAHFGQQLREDRAPAGGSTPPAQDIATLEAGAAYRDPKHPDHARVSAAIRAHYARVGGNDPI